MCLLCGFLVCWGCVFGCIFGVCFGSGRWVLWCFSVASWGGGLRVGLRLFPHGLRLFPTQSAAVPNMVCWFFPTRSAAVPNTVCGLFPMWSAAVPNTVCGLFPIWSAGFSQHGLWAFPNTVCGRFARALKMMYWMYLKTLHARTHNTTHTNTTHTHTHMHKRRHAPRNKNYTHFLLTDGSLN